MALEVGERVGDYEVIGLIGAGGMGRVYKARNIISNRDEAMKVLLPDLTTERDLAARFMVEIRTLGGLEHPNIAQLRTAFQFQNQLVMIMEFVEGATLEKLASESVLPIDQVLDYATQVLSALSFAHQHGVIHRDIKPANIMITTHGQVKLMDFGIAKNADEMHLTRPGMTIGSVYYMSPEQVRGGTVDARSDLYSFGVTLYESITGRKPFQADTSYSVLNAQLNEAPVPPILVNPSVPRQLNDIVLHAMEKSPEARFQTAQEFHDALKALRMQMASGSAAPAFAPVGVAAAAFSPTTAGFPPATAAPTQPFAAAPSSPPPFAPVAATPVAHPAAKSQRGLWIGLGALAAILALVAIAVVLPHVFSTLAKQNSTTTTITQTTDAKASLSTQQASGTQPATGAATSDATTAPADPSSDAATPADAQAAPATPSQPGQTDQPDKPAPRAKATASGGQHRAAYLPTPAKTGDQTSGGAGTSGGSVAAAEPPAPAAPSAQEIRQAKDRLLNLESRADAARSGVQSLRTQQQAQGLDIRGDILATLNRMNSDLREARASLQEKDLQAANEYMDRADKSTSRLETFLGR